jgi:hypothetical protein
MVEPQLNEIYASVVVRIPSRFEQAEKKQASRLYTKGWAGTVSEKLCNATSVESSNPGLPTQREIRDGQRGEGGKVFTNKKNALFLSHKRKILKL